MKKERKQLTELNKECIFFFTFFEISCQILIICACHFMLILIICGHLLNLALAAIFLSVFLSVSTTLQCWYSNSILLLGISKCQGICRD